MPSRHGPRELAGCCGFVVSPGPSWAKGFEADKFPAPEMVNSCVKSDEHVLEELETEGERQLKSLLQHQLDTSVSIEECMSKKESFAPGTMYKPFGKEAAGTMTLSQFQTLHEKDQETASLRELGLNETEILIWKSHVSGEKKTKLRATPEAIQNRLQDIEERISERQRILCLPQRFAKSKQLTRREMEIEKSLFQGADRHSFLKALYYQAYHKKTSADKYMTSMKRKIKLGTKDEPQKKNKGDPMNNLESFYQEMIMKKRLEEFQLMRGLTSFPREDFQNLSYEGTTSVLGAKWQKRTGRTSTFSILLVSLLSETVFTSSAMYGIPHLLTMSLKFSTRIGKLSFTP
ncbi:RNA-binding protein 41 isoform X5 [Homo sapiens]|uniref:RNA-binding protein 41 isoform X5 n=1 Tax=Homo sapiens TaxID=9606 RepID=UPI001FB17D87|nr:RNA-binding protein 41 isoform X5 [Homo sapiens]